MPCFNRTHGGPGSAGGRATAEKYGRAHMAEIGMRGAQALLNRHGCAHMREISQSGYPKVMTRRGLPFTDTREYWTPPPPDPAQLRLFDSTDADQ